MGNFGTAIKRFFTNKNTVTLLAIVVCTVLLYLFYNNRVNNAVRTTFVCYAVETIPPRTEIKSDMVSTKRVLQSQLTTNQVTDCGSIIGKYVSYATEVAENSYFYNSMIMNEEEMPDSIFDGIEDGNRLFKLPVTFDSTYGNSIFPGNYIDFYLKTNDENDQLIYGKFIQSIKVLAVKDEEGKNVFETTIETRTPSQLLFSVPEDLYLLLMKASYLGIEIVVVPRNSNYTAVKGQTLVSSDYLKQLILDQTASIPDECLLETTGTAECKVDATKQSENTNTNTNTNTQVSE